MLTPEEVKQMIAAVAPCEHIEVEGDGHHFFAHIVSSAFEGKARLARHRLIKDGLADKLASNELHALSVSSAATPAECSAKQGECVLGYPRVCSQFISWQSFGSKTRLPR